jgi:hypothetical protein
MDKDLSVFAKLADAGSNLSGAYRTPYTVSSYNEAFSRSINQKNKIELIKLE